MAWRDGERVRGGGQPGDARLRPAGRGGGATDIDDILKVEGVDVFFVGPSDLSQSMGFPGRPDTPEVKRTIDEAFAKIVAAGKAHGSTRQRQGESRSTWARVLYVYTQVAALLSTGAAEFFDTVRS